MNQTIKNDKTALNPALKATNLAIKPLQKQENAAFLPRFELIQEGLDELADFETVHAAKWNVLGLDTRI